MEDAADEEKQSEVQNPITGYYVPERYSEEIELNQGGRYGRFESLSRVPSRGGTPEIRSPVSPRSPRSPRIIRTATDESNSKIAYALGIGFMLATVAAVMSE